ncbi:MAG: O-antigen ligase family protein [Elusimicrobia bacterium]|nr:O-antigen ligase family protein [Candidatus Obscuribacterium magneticum]
MNWLDKRRLSIAFALFPSLAYLLEGAKTGFTFSILFLSFIILLILNSRNAGKIHFPKSIYLPFFLFFLWCWLPLLNQPPLETHLFFYSRILLYGVYTLFCTSFLTTNFKSLFSLGVFLTALIESLFWIGGLHWPFFPRLFLANPLHSGLLISLGYTYAYTRIQEKPIKWHKSLILLLAILICATTVYLTQTRVAFLSIVITSVFLTPRKHRTRLAFLALATTSIAFIMLPRHILWNYLEMDDAQFTSNLGRISIWKSALLAIKDKWLLGYGLGNFETAYLMHQQPSRELLRYGKSTIFAHNGALQIGVEAGLTGLLLVLWGFLSCFQYVKEVINKNAHTKWAFSVMLVFSLMSFFNYTMFLPANGLIFCGCLAILIGEAKAIKSDPLTNIADIKNVGLFILILLTPFIMLYGTSDFFLNQNKPLQALKLMPIRSELWYKIAVDEIEKNPNALSDPRSKEKIIHSLEQSIRWNPTNPFLWSRWARVLSALSPTTFNESILFAFKKATTLAPCHTPFWIQEGFYRLSINDLADAELCFKRASDQEPMAPVPFYGLALVQMRKGHARAVISYLDKTVELKQAEMVFRKTGHYNAVLNSSYATYLFSVDEKKIGEIRDRLRAHRTTRKPGVSRALASTRD